jgi:LacI family transcriptional regulator
MRVLEVVERLSYRPSAVARSLIGRRTYTIGVVASGLQYFGPSSTLTGIEKQAADSGFSVLLTLIHEPGTEEIGPVLSDMLSRQVEGIIWAVPEIGNNHRWVDNYPSPVIPIVFLSMEPRSGITVVSVENRRASRVATEHLLAQGRRHIGLITGPLTWWEAQERQIGWRDALSVAGLPAEPRQVAEGDWSAESGEHAFVRLRDQFPEMDAVFASNDQMAQGLLHAAWTAGVRVPEDLAVVGFDDIPEAAYFIPPLTTVKQHSTELGQTAVRVLNGLIDDWHRTGQAELEESTRLEAELVVRKSSI